MRAGNGGRDEAAVSRGGQRSRSGRRAAAAWGHGTCGRRLRGAHRARRGAGVVEEHADRGGVGRGVPLRAGEKEMPGPHHGVVGSRQRCSGRKTGTRRRRGGDPARKRKATVAAADGRRGRGGVDEVVLGCGVLRRQGDDDDWGVRRWRGRRRGQRGEAVDGDKRGEGRWRPIQIWIGRRRGREGNMQGVWGIEWG